MGGTHHEYGRFTRRAGIAVLLVASVLAVAVWSTASATVRETPSAGDQTFGCPGEMQVANVDCAYGTYEAFLAPAHNNGECNLMHGCGHGEGMAPWCDGALDMTRYGCDEPATTASQTQK